MFENLSDRLQNALSKLTGKGKLTEDNVNEAMREVKLALLEADVNYKVVKDFVKKIKARAIGSEVMESLTPGQQVIKIVNEELTQMMGGQAEKLDFSGKSPAVILMSGLQGAGKTTTTGKLALKIKGMNRRPLLVAADVYRPAAIKQLETVGKQVDVPVFTMGDKISPVDIAKASIEYAKKNGFDTVIIDTAGRLHIDDSMMEEIKSIKEATNPNEILLVVDAMTGQDAVNVAKSFNENLEITGVVITKLDGDARGGAALSIRGVVDKPIKYVGLGEKLTDLEVFHPDRMASRILGMGDVLSLIEKAESAINEESARELEKKLRDQSFTLDDYLDQLQQVRNMGPLEDIISMIPGMNKSALKGVNVDEKEFDRIEAIIKSMTREEREKPEIVDKSRRERIAKGSGTNLTDVNKLLKQFKELKKMMKQFGNLSKSMKKGKMRFPFSI
ncbi:signal recognition particle protein [Neofamilia massiliensis]|uniref:signal recognition particle protein n=1 Tax=Neofamilia massiliensis TaxID=1673724 RepID=UPI0006BB71BD|nr:signal recognition particle protein [Neofamilia massiliensis]